MNGTDPSGNRIALQYDNDSDVSQADSVVCNVDAFFTGCTPLLATGDETRHNFFFWPDYNDHLTGASYGLYHFDLQSSPALSDSDESTYTDQSLSVNLTRIPHMLFSISGAEHKVKTYIFFPQLYLERKQKNSESHVKSNFVDETELTRFYDNFFLPAAKEMLEPSVFNNFHLSVDDSKHRQLKSGSNMFCDTRSLNAVFKRVRELIDSSENGSDFHDFCMSSVSYGGKQTIKLPFNIHSFREINPLRLAHNSVTFIDVGFNIFFSNQRKDAFVSFLKKGSVDCILEYLFGDNNGSLKFHSVNLSDFGGCTFLPKDKDCHKFIIYSDFKQPFYRRDPYGRNGKDFDHISIQKDDLKFSKHIVSIIPQI